ncbi:MAG: AAA family ATPase [Verrucomicrobiota bacterium]
MAKEPPKDPSPKSPPSLEEMLKRTHVSFQMPGMFSQPQTSEETSHSEPDLEFFYTPNDIKRHLDRYIIGQDEAKKSLSIAVCDHYNHVRRVQTGEGLANYLKQNILLLGPTGVGKTYLIRCIADLIGVPFVKADATKFSETGYVGQDVDELVRSLVQQANGNIALAEFGIIYLDEVDKITGTGHSVTGKDVSGRGVQTNLLKLMEETEVPLRSPNDIQGQMESAFEMMQGRRPGPKHINTQHILFIASGAFAGLPEIINRRLRSGTIGFQGAADPIDSIDLSKDALFHANTQDLIDYGFEPEFIGRLPVRVACHTLTVENLYNILTRSEGSILRQYEEAFMAYRIDIDWKDEALQRIAQEAEQEETGARGLLSVLENLLREAKFELAGMGPFEITVDEAFCNAPKEILQTWVKRLSELARERIPEPLLQYSQWFKENHDYTVTFTQEAATWLKQEAESHHKPLLAYCRETFKDLPYALKLISERTDEKTYEINLEMAKSPDQSLSKQVVKFYKDSPSEEPKDS